MPENTQYQRVKEITDQLEQGIQDLFNSEQYMSWLRTMSKFHDYSLNNTLLIAFQKPDATLVAGYSAWQKQFGRQVQKGEKAIRILAPTPYKQKVEMEKIDPETQKPVLDADGKPVTETQEVTRPAFKVVSVFDVSQTEGRELPSIGVDELTGDVREYEMFFEALKRTCPVPIEFEQIQSGAKGYYHQLEQRIAIQEGMSELQTIKTAIHEMAHQRLHAVDPEGDTKEMPHLSRNSKEVEAESVAYTICQHYGIETSDYSFAYIAGWSHGKETPELKASLQTIRKAASEMINEIDSHIAEIAKEHEEVNLPDEMVYHVGEDHYLDIHRTDDGCWDFTLYGKDYLEIDGGQVGADGSMSLQEATKDILESYHIEGALTEVDREEFEQHRDFAFAKDMYDKGLVYDNYVLKSAVAYDLEEAGIDSMDYSEDQWGVIWDAAKKKLPVSDLANPELSVAQMKYMAELMEQGYDVRSYWVAGERLDLTDLRLSEEDIADIRYQAEVSGIPKMLYTPEQWREIQKGIDARVDVFVYAHKEFSAEQMKILHRSLVAESFGYLDRADIEKLADPNLSPADMKEAMKEMRKVHVEQQKSELAVTGLQENGLYRYYSTQRPIEPGSYPSPLDGNKPVNLVNFDTRQPVAGDQFQAWGYLEYEKPLPDNQRVAYELRAAPAENDRAVVPEKPARKKKSLLADLHSKQEQVAGTKAPETAHSKKKAKEMEQ